MKEFEKLFPLCKEYNPELYNETLHHFLVMREVSEKISIPLDELIQFFYKGKLRLDVIKEQEEVLKDYVDND